MIFIHWQVFVIIGFLIILFLSYCAFLSYRINTDRESDDSEKRDFHPFAPWFVPATPFIWIMRTIILAPWSILFGIFLVIFPFVLLIFRPLPENDPVTLLLLKVGDGVLKINTRLLLALGLRTKPIKFSS